MEKKKKLNFLLLFELIIFITQIYALIEYLFKNFDRYNFGDLMNSVKRIYHNKKLYNNDKYFSTLKEFKEVFNEYGEELIMRQGLFIYYFIFFEFLILLFLFIGFMQNILLIYPKFYIKTCIFIFIIITHLNYFGIINFFIGIIINYCINYNNIKYKYIFFILVIIIAIFGFIYHLFYENNKLNLTNEQLKEFSEIKNEIYKNLELVNKRIFYLRIYPIYIILSSFIHIIINIIIEKNKEIIKEINIPNIQGKSEDNKPPIKQYKKAILLKKNIFTLDLENDGFFTFKIISFINKILKIE